MSKTGYKRLGDYIREVDVRNRDLEVTKLMGINIGKYFMPSIANVIGTDLSNYKIVGKGQFACNLMHVGRDEKIPIALLYTNERIIVSPAYWVFEVSNTTQLLPDYLMLWFRRNEFDRNAWFYTDSDVRGEQENMFVHISQGSTDQTRLYCSMVRPLKIIIPDNDTLKTYSKSCRPIKCFIEQKRQENKKLQELRSLLLAKMGQGNMVETQNFASLHHHESQRNQQQRQQNKFGPQSQNLASVIRGFKIGVTKFSHQNNIPFEWQPRFHDRIIRNQEEMNRIAQYIEENISRWDFDKLNPINNNQTN